MKKEQIQDLTRRISQCNKGELIIIMYDICFAYFEDAKEAFEKEEWDVFKIALRKGQRAIDELISALDFSYDLANNLFSIYVFCKDQLAKCMYKRQIKDLEDAERLMQKLYSGFTEAAKQDTSSPLMSNTQQVYAGITYGRGDLIETCQDLDTSRGFFV